MYILILILPFWGFISCSLLGRFFGFKGCTFMSTFSLFLTWLLALIIFYEICLCHSTVTIELYNWILIDIYEINIGFLFDPISVAMILIVSTISLLVHLYSTGYMSHDPYIARFMSYLSLFTFFMLLLVTSNNFLQMFIGWEGVGLASYLLINFWFTRIAANKAALKAMIMNRIADVFFIFSIVLILLTFKTTNYIIVFNLLPFICGVNIIFFGLEFELITLITFFLFIGAIGKSAQIGFHTWLPDAMEGPTPVSALLHAATMVTAGVFLVIRCSIFFEYSENILFLLLLFGGTTAFFSGFVAIFQFDIKKIIAYSTCSQLGYMFFSCGFSNYHVAFYHLFLHAFFKALLFLSAGTLIHALFDEQDMRRMGGLRELLPFTYICFLIGSLAIMGFPFLTGFYSKDLILEFAYSNFSINGFFIYFLGLTSAIFTSIYSIRLIRLTFGNKNIKTNTSRVYFTLFEKQIVEAPWPMFISMFLLVFASIFVGYLSSELMFGLGTFFWQDSIYVLPKHFVFIDNEFIHPLIKNLPVIFSLTCMYLTSLIITYLSKLNKLSLNKKRIYVFFYNHIWLPLASFGFHAGFFNTIYNYFFYKIYSISYLINKYLDKGIIELTGPWGFYKFFYGMHNNIKNNSISIIFINIFFMFLSIFLLITFWILIFNHYWILNFIFSNLGLFLIMIILY